jgi:hypothetical protein
MKNAKIAALAVLLTFALITGVSAQDKLGLTVCPYAAMNIGNMAADGYEPVFQFDTIGVAVTYDIALGDMGKITPVLEDYAKITFGEDATTWVDTLEIGATYSIGAFGIKAALPIDLAGDPELVQNVNYFYLQPSYKISLDKPMSITLDLKTQLWLFDVYAKNEDNIRIEPRVKFAYGDFYATVRMNLYLPSFNDDDFLVYVGYTFMNITPEFSLKLSSLNPKVTDKEMGVTPYFKLSYKLAL